MNTKYFANFSANNLRYQNDLGFANLKKAIREIREIAEGNRPAGDQCTWQVYDTNGNRVAGGGMDCNGRRFRTV